MTSAATKTTDTHKNNEPASQDAAKRRSISSSAVLEANVMELQHAAGNWAVWNSRLGSVPGTPRDGSVRSPGSVVQRQPIQSEGICPTCGRRGTGQCPECGQEFVPMQPGPPSSQTTKPSGLDTVRRVLNSGNGRPLAPAVRSLMEARFQHDFRQVRIHTGEQAAASARAVNAAAYTVGNQIVFAAGQYAPDSLEGLGLLSHELTHVVQQQGVATDLQRLSLDGPSSPYEREANAAASAVLHGAQVSVHLTGVNSEVQRVPWGGCPPGPRIPATNSFLYVGAELAMLYDHYKVVRRSNVVVSNVDLLEDMPTSGPEGPMIEAMQRHFRSGRGPSPIRRGARTGSADSFPSPSEGSVFEQIEGSQPAREAAEFALLRPDIVDVTEREVYDVTTLRLAGAKVNTVRGYVGLLERIRQGEQIGGRSWRVGTTLPRPSPRILVYQLTPDLVACFGSTDFDVRPGVISYEIIRRRSRRRREENELRVPQVDTVTEEESEPVEETAPERRAPALDPVQRYR